MRLVPMTKIRQHALLTARHIPNAYSLTVFEKMNVKIEQLSGLLWQHIQQNEMGLFGGHFRSDDANALCYPVHVGIYRHHGFVKIE